MIVNFTWSTDPLHYESKVRASSNLLFNFGGNAKKAADANPKLQDYSPIWQNKIRRLWLLCKIWSTRALLSLHSQQTERKPQSLAWRNANDNWWSARDCLYSPNTKKTWKAQSLSWYFNDILFWWPKALIILFQDMSVPEVNEVADECCGSLNTATSWKEINGSKDAFLQPK